MFTCVPPSDAAGHSHGKARHGPATAERKENQLAYRLQGVLGSRANFNPEVYMGLIVEWTDSLKIILYSTGNIMLVPKITDQNREPLEHPRSAVRFCGAASWVCQPLPRLISESVNFIYIPK